MRCARRRLVAPLVSGVLVVAIALVLGLRPRGGQAQVTYRVQGTVSEAMVSYRTADGLMGQRIQLLPWEAGEAFPRGGEAHLTVQNAGTAGRVSCTVLVDGREWLSRSCEGNHCTATCRGSVP